MHEHAPRNIDDGPASRVLNSCACRGCRGVCAPTRISISSVGGTGTTCLRRASLELCRQILSYTAIGIHVLWLAADASDGPCNVFGTTAEENGRTPLVPARRESF